MEDYAAAFRDQASTSFVSWAAKKHLEMKRTWPIVVLSSCFVLSCTSNTSLPIAEERGVMFGTAMRTLGIRTFEPSETTVNGLPREKVLDMLYQSSLIGLCRADLGLDNPQSPPRTKWLDKNESSFMNGYKRGWATSVESDIQTLGYAVGWLEADSGMTKGKIGEPSTFNLDIASRVILMGRKIADPNYAPQSALVSREDQILFFKGYDNGYEQRSERKEEKGDWTHVD